MSGATQGRGPADLDLCGRIMLTHRLEPSLLADATGLTIAVAAAVLDGTASGILLDTERAERLALVANILVRIEVRLAHDSRAIRLALDRPLERLGGATPREAIAGDLDSLRRLRCAIDEMKEPATKWWRVGH